MTAGAWGYSASARAGLDAGRARTPGCSKRGHGRPLTADLACRMAQLFRPKAMDYIHRAIVQAIVDAKAEAVPCTPPPREELPQDLVQLLTGYKQVREGPASESLPTVRHAFGHLLRAFAKEVPPDLGKVPIVTEHG